MNDHKSFPKRSLGSSGIEVSAIGLGCMSLSGVYGKSSDDDGISLIHEALDQGITLLDTSDMYGFGHNEELVGKAIKGRRGEVGLATKFGNLGGGGSKIADGRRCTPGQLALAWLLAQGEDIVPIPGTKRKERLLENIGGLAVDLTEDELAQIADAIPVGAAAGLRYPEALMKSLYL
jgi:aryl-alcohol dehydrogenase-like predicted oxidoreductase